MFQIYGAPRQTLWLSSAVLLLSIAGLPVIRPAVAAEVRYDPGDKVYFTYCHSHPPAMRINSGDSVITTTRDASNDAFSVSDKSVAPKLDLTKVNPQTGPFYIEGAEPGDTAIVSSILSLAFAMGKHPIAEGVERREQAAALMRMGCTVAQGYLFSPPVPADAVLPMLERTLWRPRAERALHAAEIATDVQLRRGHRYFIDEFLDHIGAPMGARFGDGH